MHFSVPLEKKFKAFFSFPLVRKLVRVPLSLLWFGTSTTNILKIAKSTNDNLTQDKHQNNNLLRRHATDWSLFRRDSHEPRHSNFPSATSRVCHKLEKICVDTSAGNRVLGLTINSVTIELSLNKTKIQKAVSEYQNLLNNPQTSNSGVDKVDWLIDFNYSSSFTSKVELSFPSNTTNIIFIGKPFLFR